MSVQFLVNPSSGAVAAELVDDKEVIIRDQWMLERIERSGLEIAHNGRVFPNGNKELFAKAFKYYFQHGLSQQGYYWTTDPTPKSTNDLIACIFSLNHQA